MTQLKPITQKQFIIVADGLPAARWTKCSVPKEKREQIQYNDGETGRIRSLEGYLDVENVTIEKPFDPEADKATVAWYQALKKDPSKRFTVTVQPVQIDLAGTAIAGAGAITLTGCRIVTFEYPDADRSSNNLATLKIEMKPEDIQYA